MVTVQEARKILELDDSVPDARVDQINKWVRLLVQAALAAFLPTNLSKWLRDESFTQEYHQDSKSLIDTVLKHKKERAENEQKHMM